MLDVTTAKVLGTCSVAVLHQICQLTQGQFQKLLRAKVHLLVSMLKFSAVELLQGIGSENVGVCGEVHLPVQIGTHTIEKQIEADKQIQQSLEGGLASPSNSSLVSPIVLVCKNHQTYRRCVDYRALNAHTVKDMHPRHTDDLLDCQMVQYSRPGIQLLASCANVQCLARKAAVFCSRKGLFTWNVMPFGLFNMPATLQHLMDHILAGLQWETCLVYLHGIIVLGKKVSPKCSNAFLKYPNLKLKPAKCCLFRHQAPYPDHVVSAQGIATDPGKVPKVQQWPEPTCVSEVPQFIDLAAYYRRFVQDFAAIAKPLHKLNKKNVHFRWTRESQDAFKTLKSSLSTTTCPGLPT
ncbi:hypothetical protein MHYP_G00151850 [Metynnis hypsauchen]